MSCQLGHPDQMYTRQCCKNHVPNKVLRFLKEKPITPETFLAFLEKASQPKSHMIFMIACFHC